MGDNQQPQQPNNTGQDVFSVKQFLLAIVRRKLLVSIFTLIAVVLGLGYVVYRHSVHHYLVQADFQPAYTLKDASVQPIQSDDQVKSFLTHVVDSQLSNYNINYTPPLNQPQQNASVQRPVTVWTNQGGNNLVTLRAKASQNNVSNYKQFYKHAFQRLKDYQQQMIKQFKQNLQQKRQMNQQQVDAYTQQNQSIQDLINRSQNQLKNVWQLNNKMAGRSHSTENKLSQGQFYQLMMSNNLLNNANISARLMGHKNDINQQLFSVKQKEQQLKQQLNAIQQPKLKNIYKTEILPTTPAWQIWLIFVLVGLILGCLVAILVDQIKNEPQ